MFGIVSYNQIREEGGKRFLFDAQEYGTLSAGVDRYAEKLKEARAILKKYDYPDTQEWQTAIIESGKEGLERVILEENDRQAARLKIPRYVAVQWRKQAVSDAPREMWEEVGNYFQGLYSERARLPIQEGDITFNKAGTPEMNTEAIKERLKIAFSMEITPQMQEEADKVRELIARLRELDATGVNVKVLVTEYLGNRYAPSKYPPLDNDLKLLERIRQTRQQTAAKLLATNPAAYYQLGGDRINQAEEEAQ